MIKKQTLEYYDILDIVNELKQKEILINHFDIYQIAGLEFSEKGSYEWFDFYYYEDLESWIEEEGEDIAFDGFFVNAEKGKKEYSIFCSVRDLIKEACPQAEENGGVYIHIWW